MTKNNTTKPNNKETNAEQLNTTPNPFNFGPSSPTTAGTRRLDFTPVLIDIANNRASELMMNVSKMPELYDLVNKALDEGNPQDLIDLIKAVYNDKVIKTDSESLSGCDEDQLSRLLESRRSDRSKAKKKGPRTNVTVCKTYISSMYAELMVRAYWNKPYTGQAGTTATDLDTTDQSALAKKVKSLQSKKCRLGKIAQYDDVAKKELDEVNAEIARLNALRPTVKTGNTTTVIKDAQVEQLRDILKTLDINSLPEDQQAKALELIAKLG